MKNNVLAVLVFLSVFLLVGTTGSVSLAQDQGMGETAGRGPQQSLYDSSSVKTVNGEVEKVEYFAPSNGMGQGVHLQLKTGEETFDVHLGPRWFLNRQGVEIRKGDLIKVKGSLVTFDEKPALIAAEIDRGDDVLHLRDEDGSPRWGGWGRRGR